MVTVMAWERVVHYHRGQLVGVLEPGRHRVVGLRRHFHRVDMRIRLFEIGTQEVLTADGMTVKVGAAARIRVIDPVTDVEFAEDPDALLYEAVKAWLREKVRPLAVDELSPGIAVDEVPEEIAAVAAQVGLEVQTLTVRDVVIPASIRRAAEELLAARRQAQVDLERARSEVAVLRALANTSKLLAESPQLAALRLVDAAAAHGASIVIERPAT